MRLLVISPSRNEELAAKMVATARRVGIEPMLYGFESGNTLGQDYQGTDIVKILTERTDAEWVMGVDAYDLVFVGGEDEIMEKAQCFEHPMIISAEMDGLQGMRKTNEELARQCAEAGGQMPQINIGGWIGKREYALHVLNESERLYRYKPETPNYDHDIHVQYLALMKAWGGGPEFHLDWNAVIFQSMNKCDVFWSEKRLVNRITGTMPPILHYHGDQTRVAFNEAVERILA